MAWIVQSLDEEWAAVAGSPAARRALMRWASINPVLAPVRSVDDFVDTRQRPTWGEAAHRVLAAEAPTDYIAARTLLQALLGGLVSLSKRIGRDRDALGELTSLAWNRIRTYPSHRPGPVAPNVLLDVRKQYSALHRSVLDTEDEDQLFDRIDEAPTPEEVACGRAVIEELLSARNRGMVSPSAWETIIRTRWGGETLVDVAADMKMSPDAIWRRRTRAEQRLRTLPLAS